MTRRAVGGLVLEVKGDFCYRVREILPKHGREDDYVELSLDCPYRYNPLYNDLESYALAYGIASLLTNFFGLGKEPFWQQAGLHERRQVHRPAPQVGLRLRSSTSTSAPSIQTFLRDASPRAEW